MNDELDLWDDLAGQEVSAPPEPEDLPNDVWCLGVTASGDSGAAPKLRQLDRRDGSGSFYKFECGFKVMGGEGKVTSNHVGRLAFFDSFVEPGERDGANPVAGRLMGFLNAALAGGVAANEKDAKVRANARWARTRERLAAKSREMGLTLTQFEGNKALMVASAAVALLKEEPVGLLFKTKDGGTYEKDGEKKKRPTAVSQLEDYTAANISKRKVAFLSDDAPLPAGEAAGGF